MTEPGNLIETEGIPTIYCNHFIMALSYNDVRIYAVEQSPRELVVNTTTNELANRPPNNDAKCCLVFSPELAAALAKAVAGTVANYENVFGPLRPQPTPEGIQEALQKQNRKE